MNTAIAICEIDVVPSSLEMLREQINKADEQLLQSLWWRIDIVRRIGEYKKANKLEILQMNRWEDLLKQRLALAKSMGLNTDFITKMYTIIHEEAIRVQQEIVSEHM